MPDSPLETALLEIADELYGLPLPDFTPSRDALAKEHKADKELAAGIKGLKKASVAAWVVNLLVRRDPEQVEQVLTVGAALREAAADLDAAQLRELTKQRRQLTAAVTTSARRTARGEGVKVTESVAEQVEATLTSAMLDADAAKAVRSGLLVSPIVATGVGELDLSAAVALPGALGFEATTRSVTVPEPTARPQLHVVPDPEADKKARAAADERVREAETALEEAQAAARAPAETLAELEARTLQLQAEIDELRTRIAEHERALEETDDEIAEAEEARDEAEEAVAEAENALEDARRARARLDR
ncbi:hypothetical protein [Nocardioides seonyuensis]|uniref:hypothetical protein n=1 Tax=Nocardioides seonyuensis TaxID=2518371 RepID=UPI001FC9B6B1|nr:hypothetical protein [Nocardioides seonyuensis]